MDAWFSPIGDSVLLEWETVLGEWFFYVSLAFLAVELVRYLVVRKLNWALAGDTVTNFITSAMFAVLTYGLLGGLLVTAYFYFQQFAIFDIGTSWTTVLLCIVAADQAYYWEHRFTHRVGIAWATHTVHHSSPFFNISVAYRFGPMDGVWPIFFNVPLVIVGFDPLLVFFSELFVLLYQTFLHTEIIRKLPRPIEYLFNTPSHHRVHHGTNDDYIDKNYGGIFIIWDRLFGTFAEEKEQVVYGITRPIDSVNPLVVFFHGFTRLWRELRDSRGAVNRLSLLTMPPGSGSDATVDQPVTHAEGAAK